MNLTINLQVLATSHWVAGSFNKGQGCVGGLFKNVTPVAVLPPGLPQQWKQMPPTLKPAAQTIDSREGPSKANKQL